MKPESGAKNSCDELLDKLLKDVTRETLHKLDGKFLVESSSGDDWYLVDVHTNTCTCKAGENKVHCHHLDLALAKYKEKKK